MIIKRTENFELGINRIKGSPFYWRIKYSGAKDHFFKVENGTDFKWLNTWAYYVPTLVQCFWGWWSIYLKIFPQNIGGKQPQRYVKIENTHLGPLKLPHGSWKD